MLFTNSLMVEIFILIVLFFVAINHAGAEECNCENLFDKLDEMNTKLDKLLNYSESAELSAGQALMCKPITGLSSIDASQPKFEIKSINGAHGLETNGSELYMLGWHDGYVYSYNTLQTTLRTPVKLNSNNMVGRRRLTPAFLDIHGNVLYVSHTFGWGIYQIPLSGGEPKFTEIKVDGKAIQPVGIKVSPDGNLVVISDWRTGKIFVFDETMAMLYDTIDALQECGDHLREITFLSNDKFMISTFRPSFCAYQSSQDRKFQRVEIENAETKSSQIDGYYVHCDGSVIATDRSKGKLILMDKDLKYCDTLEGLGAGTIDVVVTADGTLAVSNVNQNSVRLYQLPSSD